MIKEFPCAMNGYIRSNRKGEKDLISLKTMDFITEMTDKYPLLQYL